jgi:hypothetical protein
VYAVYGVGIAGAFGHLSIYAEQAGPADEHGTEELGVVWEKEAPSKHVTSVRRMVIIPTPKCTPKIPTFYCVYREGEKAVFDAIYRHFRDS